MGDTLSNIFRWIKEHTSTGTETDSQKDRAVIKYSSNDNFILSEDQASSLPINQQRRILSNLLNCEYDFTSEQSFFEKNELLTVLLSVVTVGIFYRFRGRIISFICPHRIQANRKIKLRQQKSRDQQSCSLIEKIASIFSAGNDSSSGSCRSSLAGDDSSSESCRSSLAGNGSSAKTRR